MNKALIERVENNAVEPEYAHVTLRLLIGELSTVNIGLYSNQNDQELLAFRDRSQRAIETMEGQIQKLSMGAVGISQQHQIL